MFCSVVAKKLGSQLKVKLRQLKEGTKQLMLSVALSSDRWPKIQPVIATFSAGEFRQQLALSDNTGSGIGLCKLSSTTRYGPPL